MANVDEEFAKRITDSLSNVCPHCQCTFAPKYEIQRLQVTKEDPPEDGVVLCAWQICPAKQCRRHVVRLLRLRGATQHTYQPYPEDLGRPSLPREVPEPFASEYKEAALVLTKSAKASAALSRRCLQLILHDHLNIVEKDLSHEIDVLLTTKSLPADIAEDLDYIRHIGNFAAHPKKSLSTGEIVSVEDGEAEWLLNVLEELFDFYFVRTAQRTAQRDAFKQKLKDVTPNAKIKGP